MIDFLKNIDGEGFIVFYGVFSILILVCLKLVKKVLIPNIDILELPNLSPYMVAMIKKPSDNKHFIATIITQLYAKKYIEIKVSGSNSQIYKINNSTPYGIDRFERICLDYIFDGQSISKIIKDQRFIGALKKSRKKFVYI